MTIMDSDSPVALPAGAVLACGAVQVWTSDLADLPGPSAALDVAGAAALAGAAARASGIAGTVSKVELHATTAVAADNGALLSCIRTEAGADVELLHRAGDTAAPWVRRMQARIVAFTLSAPTAVEDAPAVPAGVIEALLQILAEVLGAQSGVDRLDPDVPLADLGLDVLRATRVRHAVEREFGVTVPARLLLQGTTVRGLAGLVAVPGPDALTDTAGSTAPAGPVARPVAALGRVDPRDPAERLLGDRTELLSRVDAAPGTAGRPPIMSSTANGGTR